MDDLPVAFQPEALADLADIFKVVLQASLEPATAEGFVRRIVTRCEKVGAAPRGGRPRNDWAPGLRTIPFERSAVIAYVVETDRVLITNIFYGGRDFDAFYQDREPK